MADDTPRVQWRAAVSSSSSSTSSDDDDDDGLYQIVGGTRTQYWPDGSVHVETLTPTMRDGIAPVAFFHDEPGVQLAAAHSSSSSSDDDDDDTPRSVVVRVTPPVPLVQWAQVLTVGPVLHILRGAWSLVAVSQDPALLVSEPRIAGASLVIERDRTQSMHSDNTVVFLAEQWSDGSRRRAHGTLDIAPDQRDIRWQAVPLVSPTSGVVLNNSSSSDLMLLPATQTNEWHFDVVLAERDAYQTHWVVLQQRLLASPKRYVFVRKPFVTPAYVASILPAVTAAGTAPTWFALL